jgi:hypothetical protein
MVVVSLIEAYDFGFVGLHLAPLLRPSRLVQGEAEIVN